MRKIVLSLLSFLAFLSATAQTPIKTIQNDSLLRRIGSIALNDTIPVPIVEQPLFFNQNLIYKLRLDSIQKVVPLSYNEYVQNYIDIYCKRKELIGKMLGLSTYYFPIFEKALIAYHIPQEIKYLPIIESSMNPHSISKVGATGMWQFMFSTAKAYGLNMDNFEDERKDPVQASYAAAAYFRDAYEELGDWLLAIAAYNCGKGNVMRAIAKAGSRDFWEIRPYLPKETRNYVPAFIAAVYVMNYAKTHQIAATPQENTYTTDSVQINKFVSLADLAKAINYEEATLFALNPSYKRKIVNGTTESPKRVILPKVDQVNYYRLYEVLNSDLTIDKQLVLAATDDVRDLRKMKLVNKPSSPAVVYYKVKPGQYLNSIAEAYHVEVQDLKVWNGLKSNTVIPGQTLKIYGKQAVVRQNENLAKAIKPKVNFVTYKVKIGDTLSGIAEKFTGTTVDSIKKANKLTKAVLQPGMLLKIRS
jgi:membrane-bound lytic murein transglycosylase D